MYNICLSTLDVLSWASRRLGKLVAKPLRVSKANYIV